MTRCFDLVGMLRHQVAPSLEVLESFAHAVFLKGKCNLVSDLKDDVLKEKHFFIWIYFQVHYRLANDGLLP